MVSLPFAHTVVSPVLVGRAAPLAQISGALDRARAGQGQVVLLAGEAGIGKSRLVQEVQHLAAERDFLLLQGRCFEQDRALAYAPWIDLLRQARAAATLSDIETIDLAVLSRLVPEIAVQVPSELAPISTEPEQDKRRLFVALHEFLIQRLPALVVVEDLHWSDDASLEFLLYLARRIENQACLVLCTYRSDETVPALDAFLATLARERRAEEIALTPLTREQVQEMIRVIFAQTRPIRKEFIEPIYTLTEGNPFFVEEILKALVSTGDIFWAQGGWERKPLAELKIPRTIQATVQSRSARLSDAARRVVETAAVAGRRFDFELLSAATGLGSDEIVRALKELIAAQLVIEESGATTSRDTAFAFRHALTREAIYTSLLAPERIHLHRALVAVMEECYDAAARDAHAADLSYHTYAAGLWDKAFVYAQRAGAKAQMLYAPRAAVEHFTHALDVADRGALVLGQTQHGLLHRARGQCYETLGAFNAAQRDYECALDIAIENSDVRAEWQALLDLGFFWAARDYERAGDYFTQALTKARALEAPDALAHTLNRVGNWYLNTDQLEIALTHHGEALALFEKLSDKRGVAETLDLMGIASYSSGDVVRGTNYYAQAVALWRELQDRRGLAASLSILAPRHAVYMNNTAVWLEIPAAERLRDGEEALQLARAMDARPAETLALVWLGQNYATLGEYGRAQTLMRQGLELAQAIEHPHFVGVAHLSLGALYLDVLAYEQARGLLEQALAEMRASRSLVWVGAAAGLLATTLLQEKNLASAQELLDEFPPDLSMTSMSQRQIWCARAELALFQEEPRRALDIVERLIASAPNIAERGEHAIPRLALLRAEALMDLKRFGQAERILEQALTAARTIPAMQWRLTLALASVYQARGRRDDAMEQFASAQDKVRVLANTLETEAERATFLRSVKALLPRAQDSERRRAKQVFDGLTAREREVAGWIAQGKSNHEIAAEMVVSYRTIEKHISNILSKLGATSRAQIAVWAVERGLKNKT